MDAAFWWDLRVAVAGLMFLGAAVMDVRMRRVPNVYWPPWILVAVATMAAGSAFDDARVGGSAIALAGASIAALWGLWQLGVIAGGADVKGLMVLAVLVPTTPTQHSITFTLDTVTWAALAALAWPLGLFVANAAQGRWRGPAPWLAWPMPIDRIRDRHVWPMERIAAPPGARDGTTVWRTRPDPDEDMDHVLKELEAAGLRTVWAGPKIPFMVPLLAGVLLSDAVGNPMLRLLALLGL